MHHDELNNLAIELSENVARSPDYLSYYHKAHAQVEESLTDDQHQRYKAMAKEWTEIKPSPEMQQR